MTHRKLLRHGQPSKECQLSSFVTLSHELHSFFLKRTPCTSFSKYLPKCTAEVSTGAVQLVSLTTGGLIRDKKRGSHRICNMVPEKRSRYYAMGKAWAQHLALCQQTLLTSSGTLRQVLYFSDSPFLCLQKWGHWTRTRTFNLIHIIIGTFIM